MLSLVFNLSWVFSFTLIQALRGASKHFVYALSWVTVFMLAFELYRELIVLFWNVHTQPTPVRVWVYGAEHVLLGMILMEVLHYVEICKMYRKRSRRLD